MTNEPGIEDKVIVDLKVSSLDALNAAISRIQESITERGKADQELMKFHLEHIFEEVSEKPSENRLLSLDHLELMERYCLRIVPETLSDDLKALREKVLAKIEVVAKNHPMAGYARSGDREDGGAGTWEQTALKVPKHRRFQTFVILYLNLLTGPLLVLSFCVFLWWIIPYGFVLWLGYVAWVWYDNKHRENPTVSRVSDWWRGTIMYKLFRDYFPIRHFKTNKDAVYDKSSSYLFCYHPHGVQSAGAFCMASKASGFDELFPGLPPTSVQTLKINFQMPFTRENLMGLGMGDASKKCLTQILSKNAPGSSAVLVTGGAKESMMAHPYESKVVLKDRAGFVKIALKTGASLVPMWGFGENNLYENLAISSPSVVKWQRRIQKIITFAPLLVAGRGVFSYAGGLIPRRRPITVAIGEPIKTGDPDPNPSPERIREVHEQYKAAVRKIFDQYKDIYDPKAKPLEFY